METIEDFSKLYAGKKWTLIATVIETDDNSLLIPTTNDDGSEYNDWLACLIFDTAVEPYDDIHCLDLTEYLFEVSGNVTKEEIKQYVEDVCDKYGFNIVWKNLNQPDELEETLLELELI